jgi:hypothetical protein
MVVLLLLQLQVSVIQHLVKSLLLPFFFVYESLLKSETFLLIELFKLQELFVRLLVDLLELFLVLALFLFQLLFKLKHFVRVFALELFDEPGLVQLKAFTSVFEFISVSLSLFKIIPE